MFDPEEVEDAEKFLSMFVCDECLTDNLIKRIGIISCSKCKRGFCIHFASKIDPQYCGECMSDVQVSKETIHKVYEHYNEETDIYTRYSRKARRINISGQDWLFAQRKIKDLTDEELDMVIEYHRSMCNLLLAENEERKNKKMHRYAGVKVTPIVAAPTVAQPKASAAKAQLKSLMAGMLAKGLKPEQIAAMLKGMGK